MRKRRGAVVHNDCGCGNGRDDTWHTVLGEDPFCSCFGSNSCSILTVDFARVVSAHTGAAPAAYGHIHRSHLRCDGHQLVWGQLPPVCIGELLSSLSFLSVSVCVILSLTFLFAFAVGLHGQAVACARGCTRRAEAAKPPLCSDTNDGCPA